MKLRGGFVSNSSSSSFVIALPKYCTPHEVEKLMFGDGAGEKYEFPFEWRDEKWRTDSIAEAVHAVYRVWRKIFWDKDEEELKKFILSEMLVGHVDEFPPPPISNNDEEWEKWEREREEVAKKLLDKFMEEHKGKDIILVTFGDEHGLLSSAIEHGDALDRLPHIRICQH